MAQGRNLLVAQSPGRTTTPELAQRAGTGPGDYFSQTLLLGPLRMHGVGGQSQNYPGCSVLLPLGPREQDPFWRTHHFVSAAVLGTKLRKPAWVN